MPSTGEVIDSVARARLDSHEKFCVERAEDARKFETDMRSYLVGLNDKLQHNATRIHERIDRILSVSSGAIILWLGTAVVGLIIYIWQHKA